MNNGPWQVRSSRRAYADEFIDVKVDQVIGPDRRERTYSTVNLKPGVAVLALDSDNSVYLTKQYRYAIERDSIEVVCGGIEEGTDALAAAKKELREEIGIQAREWTSLGILDMDSSVIHCPLHLYLATGLTQVRSKQEASEDINYFTVPFKEAVEMVLHAQITQAVSCALIMRARFQLRGVRTE
jgi:ADP-ribose pyrophosphatase